jgi:hypothetical protein
MNRNFATMNGPRAAIWVGGKGAGLLFATLAAAASAVFAQEPANVDPAPASQPDVVAPPLGREYQSFQLVNDRNIFNPNRTRRSRYDEVEPEKPKEPKIEVVALTGTLSYDRGTVAFFDSTSSEFRKAAKVGDQIAGYALKEITQSQVALERESQLLQLKVGQQLRRQDEGAWEVTSEAVIPGGSTTASRSPSRRDGSERSSRRDETAAAAPSDSTTPASSPGEGPSEALKRLLEQRKKEKSP